MKQLKSHIGRLTKIRSTLQIGTLCTFFKEKDESKGKVLVETIGTLSPFGIRIGGKINFFEVGDQVR